MESENEIRDAIGKFVDERTNVFKPIFATVLSVNETERTCVVDPINDEANIFDVKILADPTTGWFMMPSVDSTVVVSMLDKDNAFVVLYSKIDKIIFAIENQTLQVDSTGFVFNGGNFNGLVKVAELVQKLNTIENDLNTLKQVFSTGWIVLPNDGGAALKLAAATWAGALITPITTQADLENTKIKHGG